MRPFAFHRTIVADLDSRECCLSGLVFIFYGISYHWEVYSVTPGVSLSSTCCIRCTSASPDRTLMWRLAFLWHHKLTSNDGWGLTGGSSTRLPLHVLWYIRWSLNSAMDCFWRVDTSMLTVFQETSYFSTLRTRCQCQQEHPMLWGRQSNVQIAWIVSYTQHWMPLGYFLC